MNTLFPLLPLYPEGFNYFPSFISKEEEKQLLHVISEIALQSFQFRGYSAIRNVASFGIDWDFEKSVIKRGKEIPKSFDWLILRVAEKLSILPQDFAELLVTEYPEGSIINWHRDAPPFEMIAGISLQADCLFRLRPHEKEKQNRKAIMTIPVNKCSLYVMMGEAREAWQHSIAPVDTTRYSITLRTMKKEFRT